MIGIALQVVACVTTFAAIWLMGNKKTIGPALGIVSDVCFFAVNIYADLWITGAFCAGMTAIHARNFIKWRKENT